MGPFLTAVIIFLFMVMKGALWVLIWDVVDNLKTNNLVYMNYSQDKANILQP